METKQQKELNIFIGTNYENWSLAHETFGKPFSWLLQILKNMTGFSYPSGYALLSHQHKIVKEIWVGTQNEYPLYSEIEYIDSCIYIDNYESPERSIYGWKNLYQSQLEEIFGIKFDKNQLNKLGGFPKNLKLIF